MVLAHPSYASEDKPLPKPICEREMSKPTNWLIFMLMANVTMQYWNSCNAVGMEAACESGGVVFASNCRTR